MEKSRFSATARLSPGALTPAFLNFGANFADDNAARPAATSYPTHSLNQGVSAPRGFGVRSDTLF